MSDSDNNQQMRDWVIAIRASALLIVLLITCLLAYLLQRADVLTEGVVQRRIEIENLRTRVNLLESQMAADPSRTGGVPAIGDTRMERT